MTTITTPATTPNAATTATSNTNDDGINDNKAGGEEDPMAAFDRILKSPSRHQERQRNDYLKRLTSFSTAGMAYFAKPASISPLVCARFGWKIVDTDLLICEKCQAALAVTYLPGLSTFATDKVTCSYERQLGLAHTEVCRFRIEAIRYFDVENNKSNNASIIPMEWASYLSSDLMELAESSRPILVLGQQVKECLIKENVAWEKIYMETHVSLKQYKGPGSNSTGMLEENLAKSLSCADFRFEDVSVDRVKIAILMVLLGWKPNAETSTKECVSLHCDVCKKTSEAPLLLGEQSSYETEPQAKRLRTSAWDPLLSHRYYCPYVCGFPRHGATRDIPLWKALADRLLENTSRIVGDHETDLSNTAGKSEWVQANALLNAGISRKGKVPVLE